MSTFNKFGFYLIKFVEWDKATIWIKQTLEIFRHITYDRKITNLFVAFFYPMIAKRVHVKRCWPKWVHNTEKVFGTLVWSFGQLENSFDQPAEKFPPKVQRLLLRSQKKECTFFAFFPKEDFMQVECSRDKLFPYSPRIFCWKSEINYFQ